MPAIQSKHVKPIHIVYDRNPPAYRPAKPANRVTPAGWVLIGYVALVVLALADILRHLLANPWVRR